MKNFIKKIGITALAAGLAASFGAVSASATDVVIENNTMSNGIISVSDDSVYFTMKDASGNKLLYSFTSKGIYNVDNNYNDLIGGTNPQSSVTDKSFSAESNFQNVNIKRTLRIVGNTVTGQEDTLEVSVTATNNDTQNHTFSTRIMLDTQLGDNDFAPFRVPNYGSVTKCVQFEGSNVPLSFNTFDDLSNPKIVTAGTFLPGSEKPDIVQFNDWNNARSFDLIAYLNENNSLGDSSVSGIWKDRTLAPGQSFRCRMYYGLSHVNVSTNSELVLGANKSAGSFSINEEGTGYEPVSVLSYLKNAGDVDLSNVEVSLDLPNGVETSDGKTSRSYSSIPVNADVNQDSWELIAQPSGVDRNVTVIVNAKSSETGEVDPVKLTFTIPAIEGASVIEDTTAPTETTVEETTVAETSASVEPTNGEDATSATKPVKKATPGEATPGEATRGEATPGQLGSAENGQGIQTGSTVPAVIMLVALFAAAGAAYWHKKKLGE